MSLRKYRVANGAHPTCESSKKSIKGVLRDFNKSIIYGVL